MIKATILPMASSIHGQHLSRQFQIIKVIKINTLPSVNNERGRILVEHLECCELSLQLIEVLLTSRTIRPSERLWSVV